MTGIILLICLLVLQAATVANGFAVLVPMMHQIPSSTSPCHTNQQDHGPFHDRAMMATHTQLCMSSNAADPSDAIIQQSLNTVPVFCVVNEKGEPLEYSTAPPPEAGEDGGGDDQEDDEEAVVKMPFFYCSVQEALGELKKAKEIVGDAAVLDVVPFPLGAVLAKDARCVVVPSATAVEAAGAPPGSSPIGQVIPLFCCMDIMQQDDDSDKPLLPLFLEKDQAEAAMKEAVDVDGGNLDDFEISILALPKVVELLATTTNNNEAPGFLFIPPAASMDFIEKYLTDDGGGQMGASGKEIM